MSQLGLAELEAVYDALAAAINQVGTEQESLFLTKLVLLLANQLGDQTQIEQAITTALRDL
ncbi:Protein of unknown function [Thiothrix eikelboomii]|uniref:DUF2783 domain-containing protein n=1 Tax=Thiothrix eikelboomii TaxID=92487 RepID=A0A1T4VWS0_9GAMM|nr:DUF2783 domain-containing protein [Thiothrix eikelboomii]SKA69452.1 Protein of unknown function [Thiothrix eikelboomii]